MKYVFPIVSFLSIVISTLHADMIRTPGDMAMVHERSLASFAGSFTPPGVVYVQDKGVVTFPNFHGQNFPQPFIDGLAPTNEFGVTVYPVHVVVDPISGDTLFYNITNQIIDAIVPVDFSPDWIARLKYGDDPQLLSPLDPLCEVDKVVSRWTFVVSNNIPAYLSAKKPRCILPPPRHPAAVGETTDW